MSWYYASEGRQAGPVDESAFEELVRTGVVQPDSLVWREGMSGWQPLKVVRPESPPPSMPSPGSGLVFCAECGRPFSPAEVVTIGAAAVCAMCKPVYLQKLRERGQSLGGRKYGGFWIRVAAKMIDGVLLSIVNLVFFLFIPVIGANPDPAAALGFIILIQVGSLAAAATYETYFVGSRGGTPGKLILNLRIIRADGSRVSYGLAAGRYFASIISSLTLGIGYFMAGFDEEKRSLHDRICDTRVVYNA